MEKIVAQSPQITGLGCGSWLLQSHVVCVSHAKEESTWLWTGEILDEGSTVASFSHIIPPGLMRNMMSWSFYPLAFFLEISSSSTMLRVVLSCEFLSLFSCKKRKKKCDANHLMCKMLLHIKFYFIFWIYLRYDRHCSSFSSSFTIIVTVTCYWMRNVVVSIFK